MRARLYDKIRGETRRLMDEGRMPTPFATPTDLFSLILVAADLSNTLRDELTHCQADIQRIAPWMSLMTPEMLHVTLFPLYIDQPGATYTNGSKEKRLSDAQTLATIASKYLPLDFEFKGINITPDGTIIVQGDDKAGKIDRMRAELHAALPNPGRRPPNLVHITLGRYKTGVVVEEFKKLVDWVELQKDRSFSSLQVKNPVFRATCEKEGKVFHAEAMRELSESKLPFTVGEAVRGTSR